MQLTSRVCAPGSAASHGPASPLCLLAGALIAVFAVALPATPASAHAGDSQRSSNFRVTLHAPVPPVPGVTVRLVQAGSAIELRNDSPSDVTVLGYRDEPYLRVGPDGTYQNEKSPTLALDGADGPVDPAATSAPPPGEPDWQKISDKTTVRWHDHRTDPTPALEETFADAPPTGSMLAARWNVPLATVIGPSNVSGDLTWVPPPEPQAKYALAAFLAMVIAGLTTFGPWRLAVLLALPVLIAADLVHLVLGAASEGEALAIVGGMFTGFPAVVAWVMAGLAMRDLRQSGYGRDREGLFFALFAALIMGIIGGFGEAAMLSHSQLPTAGPPSLARWGVAVSMGLSAGLALGCLLRLLRFRPGGAERTESLAAPVD